MTGGTSWTVFHIGGWFVFAVLYFQSCQCPKKKISLHCLNRVSLSPLNSFCVHLPPLRPMAKPYQTSYAGDGLVAETEDTSTNQKFYAWTSHDEMPAKKPQISAEEEDVLYESFPVKTESSKDIGYTTMASIGDLGSDKIKVVFRDALSNLLALS